MDIDFCSMTLRLAPTEFVRLDRALGARFSCTGGTAWLTIDRDPRDVILAPGDEFLVDSEHAVMVGALAPNAVLEVRRAPAAKPAVWRSLAILIGRLRAGPATLPGARL